MRDGLEASGFGDDARAETDPAPPSITAGTGDVRTFGEVETPALLVDAAVFEANIAAADALLRSTGKRLRPHVKTHGSPQLAVRQLTPVTCGVTCATVEEAEVMVEAGIRDVLLANELVTPSKLTRLAALAREARVSTAVDASASTSALSSACTDMGVEIGVLVDIDIGLGRTGVSSIEAAVELGRHVERAPGLRLAGLMGYEGRLQAGDADRTERLAGGTRRLREIKAVFQAERLEVGVVSGGGTSTLLAARENPTLTEIQAGTYAFMEDALGGLRLPFRCAVAVLATVISNSKDRVVVDAGRKAIGCEYGPPIPMEVDAEPVKVGEEHTVLSWSGHLPQLGERVVLRPSNVGMTFYCHDQAWLVRGGTLVERVVTSAARHRKAARFREYPLKLRTDP